MRCQPQPSPPLPPVGITSLANWGLAGEMTGKTPVSLLSSLASGGKIGFNHKTVHRDQLTKEFFHKGSTMNYKRYLTVLLVMFLFALPTWAQEDGKKGDEKKVEADKKADQKSDEKKAKDKKDEKKDTAKVIDKHNLSFTPPKGWIKVKPKREIENLVAVYAAPSHYPNLNVQVVGRWAWPTKKDKKVKKLEEYKYLLEAFAEDLKKIYKSRLKTVAKVRTISGEDRFVVELETRYSRKVEGKDHKLVVVQWIVFYQDLTAIFTFTSHEDKYKDLKPAFMATLDSIKRTGK